MTSRLLIRPGAPGQPVLWTVDPRGRETATDADELGLDEELAETIEEWLDDLDAAYDEAAEAHGLTDEVDRRETREIAEGIADALREDLGEDWIVEVDLSRVLPA